MRKTAIAGVAAAALVAGIVALQAVDSSGAKRQTKCPVTGAEIDPRTSPHVDWEGQRVYLADADAVAAFRRDPEKAFAAVASAGVELENVETNCPVSGEKLLRGGNPTVSYKGRTIRFCCDSCPAKFDLDPARYLAAMPGEQRAGE